MKLTIPVVLLFIALLAACSHKATGPTSIMCACDKDSASLKLDQSYDLGNKYPPFDSTNHINPYYHDSCTALQLQIGYDTSYVLVISL